MEYLKIVEELNGELYDKYNETELLFSYATTGFADLIKFDGFVLWSSEGDGRDYVGDELEPLEQHIRKEFNRLADKLRSLKL